jgi:hypothetical protein
MQLHDYVVHTTSNGRIELKATCEETALLELECEGVEGILSIVKKEPA